MPARGLYVLLALIGDMSPGVEQAMDCLNYTKFGQFILGKIIKIVSTSCQTLRLKCTKFDFDWALPQTLLSSL